MVFDTFILHPSRAPKWAFSPFVKSQRAIFYEAYNFLQADFAARVKFRPQWAGQGDGSEGPVEESVMLQPVGWQEMMQKIVKIQVEYQPPEVYPNKVAVRPAFCGCGMSVTSYLRRVNSSSKFLGRPRRLSEPVKVTVYYSSRLWHVLLCTLLYMYDLVGDINVRRSFATSARNSILGYFGCLYIDS